MRIGKTGVFQAHALGFAVHQHDERAFIAGNGFAGLWAAIAADDDWAPFQAKLARLEAARVAWGFTS